MIESKLTNSPEDQSIKAVLTMLQDSGLIDKYQGHCSSAAKSLYSLLLQNGIRSRVEVCDVMLRVHKPNEPQQLIVIGYAEEHVELGREDLHAVVITETTTPWLIDTSIKKWLPTEGKVICEPAVIGDPILFGNYSNPLYSITYTKRYLPDPRIKEC
jgi:hypothetical protein